MLGHMVYFTLHDNSPEKIQALIASAHKHLSGHPGTVLYATGTRAKQYQRPVNDQDFDVALHVVFEDTAAHDAYQVAPRHYLFIEECKPNWKTVRVFDADVTSA